MYVRTREFVCACVCMCVCVCVYMYNVCVACACVCAYTCTTLSAILNRSVCLPLSWLCVNCDFLLVLSPSSLYSSFRIGA